MKKTNKKGYKMSKSTKGFPQDTQITQDKQVTMFFDWSGTAKYKLLRVGTEKKKT